MFNVIMRSLIIVILIFNVFVDGKSTKKPKDENPVLNKKLTGKSTKTQPAIIAIEIVDPNENSTTTKNTKRTIGGSLGYGYQNDFNTHPPPPRYEVYKYSQHDIPPYPNNNNDQYNQQTNQYNVQESISYQQPQNNQDSVERFYQPGTTLFSTINNQGHIGGLSTQLPQQYDPQVPVIILKVYPSQLADSGASLHANLPQTHPLAAMVNSIDIQALLAKYVHNMVINQNYQQQQQQYQHDGLITDENYPKDTHTRIIFRDNKIQPKIVQSGYNSVPQMQGYYYNLQQNQEPVVQSYYYQQQEQPQQQQYYQNEQNNYEEAPQTRQQQQNYLQNYQDYSEIGGFAPPPPSPPSSSPSQHYQYAYQENSDEVKPHNYHAHPKRSQRAKNSRGRPFHLISQSIMKDIKQLNPIK